MSEKVHNLKTWPEFYHEVVSGNKKFELRKDDRDFKKGDRLHLVEYHPETGYTGKSCTKKVKYILRGEKWGIKKGYAILGL